MHNHYTSKEYYTTSKYDDLIKSELKIDRWVFLSDYIVFEPQTKRKFILKKLLFERIESKNNPEIIGNNKNFQELKEKYLIGYEKFKNKYNTGDIYPYIFNTITNDQILYNIKYCCYHDFLPNILWETDSFLEVEYLDSSEWRPTTPRERSSNNYFNSVNDYCLHIHDLTLCITIDNSQNDNVMINKKTGKFKNIDIGDMWPPNHFIPNICWYTDEIIKDHECYVLRTDYTWSSEIFNKSFEYYKDLLKIINIGRIYLMDIQIYYDNDYKNLPHRI